MTVRQRAAGDCGCAALATALGETYEDVYVAMSRVDPTYRGKQGLHNAQIVAAAKRLGVRLIPTRAYDLDGDTGVLRVRWNDPTKRIGGHFVALLQGRICCPDAGISVPWRDYLEGSNGRACTLLKVAA